MTSEETALTQKRRVRFTLWLLLHSPRHVAFSDLATFMGASKELLHHDLNWMATFLNPFELVVDPSVDQRVAIYGRETNVIRAIHELLGQQPVTHHQTRFVLDVPSMETKLAQRVDQLNQLIAFEDAAWQPIYNYLWTLTMRYQYGRVKRDSLARLFTPDQLALITAEKTVHQWSQETIDNVESMLHKTTSLPVVEAYLLTLRVWLLTH